MVANLALLVFRVAAGMHTFQARDLRDESMSK